MKTRFFSAVALLLLSAGGARAQYSDLYYHRTGDTIEWRSEIGYYDWWPFEYLYENNLPLFYPSSDGYETFNYSVWAPRPGDTLEALLRYYTPTPLRVVGLAGSCVRGHRPNPPYTLDTDAVKDYFVLYDAQPDSFPLLGRLEWNPFDAHRTLYLGRHIPLQNNAWPPVPDSCCVYSPGYVLLPIYEYYFDSAITVSDSFYVGFTFNAIDITSLSTEYYTFPTRQGNSQPCNEVQIYHAGICWLGTGLYKSRCGGTDGQNTWTFAEAPWYWSSGWPVLPMFPIVYPLIEVDTTMPPTSLCLPVANVEVSVGDSVATVTWDDMANYTSVLLRYGPFGVAESQWTVEDVTGSSLYTLTGLNPDYTYGVSLKVECEKKVQDWSSPVYFRQGDTTGGGEPGTGVEQATALSGLTSLSPNPARDGFRVTSSFGLRRIEMHDLQGVLVYSEPKLGHEAEVRTHELLPGTYIVTVCTEGGTTHKRLLIAR